MSGTSNGNGGRDDLPPSARYVLDIIEQEGSPTRQELLERTGLPESTLDDALRTLENRQCILRSKKSGDLTQTIAELRR